MESMPSCLKLGNLITSPNILDCNFEITVGFLLHMSITTRITPILYVCSTFLTLACLLVLKAGL